MKAPRAVLFDLDETLLDRSASLSRYASQFLRDFADSLIAQDLIEVRSTIVNADGGGYRPRQDMFQDLLRLLTWRNPGTSPRLQEHWELWFPKSSVAREKACETVVALHASGIRVGIVTNGRARIQQAKIDQLRLEPYLSATVISESVGIRKPDAGIFALALAQVGCKAEEAWFVGDHPVNDVMGATAAGLTAFWIRAFLEWPVHEPPPANQISSLEELAKLAWLRR